MNILAGGLLQETNTFSPIATTIDHFRSHLFRAGEELGNMPFRNEMFGFYEAAREEAVAVIPTLYLHAHPAGRIGLDDLHAIIDMFVRQFEQAPACDGVYFALHGAMAAQGCDDVEGELVAAIRRQLGTAVPLVVSLDPHANVTERLARQVNAIVGYRTYPHTDFDRTGYRAGKLLFRIVRGESSPHLALRKLPMIVPAENSQTTHGPFAQLWREAEAGEREGRSTVTSLFPVQPWLDITELGFAVVVVGDEREAAERECERLAELVWDKRHEFDVQLASVADIVKQAIEKRGDGEPFIVSDSADSAGAGATGDSNTVLKELLAAGAQYELNCLVTLVDAAAVEQAIAVGVGRMATLDVGYAINRRHGSPITITGLIRRIGDGDFRFGNGFIANMTGRMGRCVVIEIGTISLLLAEKSAFIGDSNVYRTMGLEPREADIVQVKSANQFRADFGRYSSRIYILDTPGDSTPNLRSLKMHRVSRPFYPFDDHFDWRATGSRPE
ncbi:M81 family metallopeptidase [Paenibacillus cymbidii]|uniref:M81 family metallopeptidase n=1 Tax=Paenibacillus cymbidii TaxID=1639034 RepID=UPI00107FEFEF|nr:M81 family metallopeptidase [Paenibacillus cymbidii]